MTSFSIKRGYRRSISAPAPIDDTGTPAPKRPSRAVRRESRLTFGGIVYIAVTLFLAVGAINSQNNLLFWLFGVAIATLIVSGIFSGNALMKTRLRSRAFKEVSAGQTLRLHYTVKNRSRFFPLFAALISEIQDQRNAIGTFLPASVIHIGPGQSGSFVGILKPTRRGRVTLKRIRLSTRFPFGLLQKSLIFEQPRTLLVLPHKLQLHPGLLRHTHAQGEQARRRSARGGRSDELWGLREYVPGDPRRRISWKHSARRSELVVVEHTQTISSRIWIWIIEPDADTGQRAQLTERAIAAAASLIEQGASRSIPIGLWFPQRGLRIEPMSGRSHAGRVQRALAMVDLDLEESPLTPPPTRERDRVIVFRAGGATPNGTPDARVLDMTKPESWLADPSSLPEALGGKP
ncbi:MAG: hypothetical protein CMJ35_13550 [Phycisphaerae bacterium]|nr:hypothetical protein [Phycisphaerae bacterium]MBM91512.1 hypothetical protein [Phycisphaerae bacterium]MBM92618.1 hypothetical protein [Phycisphaerae bacterium]HCT45597.1 hypothetical protein [Phycisphaerales bacterium]